MPDVKLEIEKDSLSNKSIILNNVIIITIMIMD